MTALTVDHGLRTESANEAAWVHALMSENKIAHEILLWSHAGEVPHTKIQECGRTARYDLLSRWCEVHAVQNLLTAHHQDDQVETFFMRLAHRSGLKGLSSMRVKREMPFGLLLRPFLSIPKERLFATLQHYNVHWCDDPSNTKDRFERVRIRKTLTQMYEQDLLSPFNIVESIKKLQAVDDFVDQSIALFFKSYELAYFPLKAFQEQHPFLQRRILSCVVKELSLARYAPPDASIENACQKLMNPKFKGVTLGGLHFRRSASSMVQVIHEKRRF
jgi:tRNA(Ile)-lysidine synthase